MRLVILTVTISIVAVIGLVVAAISFDADDNTYRNESMNPEISSFGEGTYVVWAESISSEFFDVYFTKITNNTLIEEPLNLTQGTSFYPRAQVLASENNVYVLWEDRISPDGDEGIFFKKSNDGGKTFGDTETFDHVNDSGSFPYRPITMTESAGILYVFMSGMSHQTSENIIVLMASADRGNTFGKPEPFFQFDSGIEHIDVVFADGAVYAVSSERHHHFDESGNMGFRKITSDGNTGDVINLDKTGYFVNSLGLAASDDNVYVITVELADEWQDDGLIKEKQTLFFTKSNNGGNTFEESKKINIDLDSNGVENQGIHIFAYDSTVYIMWEEDYTDGYGNIHRKTWFAKSNDYGETFDAVSVHPLDELRSKYGHIYPYEENNTLYFVVTSEVVHFNEDVTIFFSNSSNNNSNHELGISKVVNVVDESLPTFDVPKIIIHDNDVKIIGDVLFGENCILYISSDDGGESFAKPVNLSPNGTLEDCFTK